MHNSRVCSGGGRGRSAGRRERPGIGEDDGRDGRSGSIGDMRQKFGAVSRRREDVAALIQALQKKVEVVEERQFEVECKVVGSETACAACVAEGVPVRCYLPVSAAIAACPHPRASACNPLSEHERQRKTKARKP